MSSFWHCYYHFVWATKNREYWINTEIEAVIIDMIYRKSNNPMIHVYAANTMPDHVHIAVSLPPTVFIPDWMKLIKGASSYEINRTFTNLNQRFRWQKGYSVHTFGRKMLSFVVKYIENQKHHHNNDTIEAYLETVDMS